MTLDCDDFAIGPSTMDSKCNEEKGQHDAVLSNQIFKDDLRSNAVFPVDFQLHCPYQIMPWLHCPIPLMKLDKPTSGLLSCEPARVVHFVN